MPRHLWNRSRDRLNIECYLKWLRLQRTKIFIRVSDKIRTLQESLRQADDRLTRAKLAYMPYLDQPGIKDSKKKVASQKEYWSAYKCATEALETLSKEEVKACERFGLVKWLHYDDSSITVENADCFVNPSYPIEVLRPSPESRIDLNAEADKEMRNTLERKGQAGQPSHRKYSMADKDGWLTLRVNVMVPFEELEQAFKDIVQINQGHKPATRNRPDTVQKALETFSCYEQTKRFSLVAKQLARKVTTVKGQYVRACLLISGEKPSGTMKQRRAGMIGDPAAWFQNHHGSCSRCQKADIPEDMCAKAYAYITQDEKALRERLNNTQPM